jgi:hypothetical protein
MVSFDSLGGYTSLLVGEATTSALRLQLAVQDTEAEIPTIFVDPPCYSLENYGWTSPYLEQDVPPEGDLPPGVVMQHQWRPKSILAETCLVGAASIRSLEAESRRFRDVPSSAAKNLALPQGAESDRSLEWIALENAWWLPVLQPVARLGDYLVLMQVRPAGLQFALAGPLQAVRAE